MAKIEWCVSFFTRRYIFLSKSFKAWAFYTVKTAEKARFPRCKGHIFCGPWHIFYILAICGPYTSMKLNTQYYAAKNMIWSFGKSWGPCSSFRGPCTGPYTSSRGPCPRKMTLFGRLSGSFQIWVLNLMTFPLHQLKPNSKTQ